MDRGPVRAIAGGLCALALLALVPRGPAGPAAGRGARAAGAPSAPGGRPLGAWARVVRVLDGDTFVGIVRGHDETVRLIGVDAPEIPHGARAGACFGPAARAYATRRLLGRRVRLVFDVGRRDRYGRLLAYVRAHGRLVNLALVRLGYARALAVAPDTRMAGSFRRAEAAAREAGRGLWEACPPGPPDDPTPPRP